MFDVDGTLIESFRFDEDCYVKAVYEALGQQINSDWESYKHVTDAGILDQHLKENNLFHLREELHHKVKNLFTRHITNYLYHNSVKPIEGVKEFLNRLRSDEGISISIATGGWKETAILKLESAGIDTDGIHIASSNDHHARTEIMKCALRESQCSHLNSVTYFGDGPWDKIACAELNFNFVAVGNKVVHHQQINDFTFIGNALRYAGL